MPTRIHQHRGYRISIYSPSGHFAVVTAPDDNGVINLGERQARSTIVEGADVCLARAIELIDDQLAPRK